MLEIQLVITNFGRANIVMLGIEVLIQRILWLILLWTGVVPLVALGHLAGSEAIVRQRNRKLRRVLYDRACDG